MRIRAATVAGSPSGKSTLGIFVISGTADPFYMMMTKLGGTFEATLDSDGFPIIDTIELDGSIMFQELRRDGFEWASGEVAAELRISELPVEDDKEPPIVARPDLTPEELRAAPSVLRLGDKALVFTTATVFQRWGTGTVGLSIWIKEESLHNVDEGRMDFAWVARESDVWQPELGSIWNNYEFVTGAGDGPSWPVGAVVDIVVGFVDREGDVQLMRATTTVDSDL